MVLAVEELGQRLWASGLSADWFKGADAGIMGVAGDVNGHLLELLLSAHGYHDVACVELFRKGAPACSLLLGCSRFMWRCLDGWDLGAQR